MTESGAGSGDGARFRKSVGLAPDAPLLAILPGSRRSETSRLLPIISNVVRDIANQTPDLAIAIPVLAHLADDIKRAVRNWPVDVHFVTTESDKFDVFAASTAALAASGTVALELAMARTPHVTIYKMNPVTAFLARLMVKVRFANLVNILMDREVVPEMVLAKCQADLITPEISELLVDQTARNRQIEVFPEVLAKLTDGDELPSVKAARVVLDVIAEHAKLRA